MSLNGTSVDAIRGAISDEEIIDIEKDLIRIPSYTMEETKLAESIVELLESEGIEASLQEVPIPEIVQTKTDNEVTQNVVGKLEGSGDAPSLMFNGHMDHGPWDVRKHVETDFSDWERDPWDPVEEDGRIYGKGAQDEKGGICGMLAAAIAIKRADIDLGGDIYFCPVAGHKSHSVGTKRMMEIGPYADYGINTENSGNWIVPAHIGFLTAQVFITGADPRMASRLPELAGVASGFKNAIRFVEAIGDEGKHPKDGWTKFNPHPVLKEWPSHRVDYIDKHTFDRIEVGLVIKTVPGMSPETVKRDLYFVLNKLEATHDDFGFEGVETESWGPPLDTPFNSPVVESLSDSYLRETGEKSKVGIEGRYGAYGCGSVMAAAGIETCIFGPGGGGAFDPVNANEYRRKSEGDLPPDEYINTQELVDSARTMALAAAELCT